MPLGGFGKCIFGLEGGLGLSGCSGLGTSKYPIRLSIIERGVPTVDLGVLTADPDVSTVDPGVPGEFF